MLTIQTMKHNIKVGNLDEMQLPIIFYKTYMFEMIRDFHNDSMNAASY